MRSSVKARLTVSLAAAAIVVGVGCGGGDDGSSTSPPLEKAEFIEQANNICRNVRANLKEKVSAFLALPSSQGKPRPVLNADLAHLVLLPTIETELALIVRLKPPPRDREQIAEMLSSERFAVDRVALTGRIASIGAVKREFAEASRLFRAYGLDDCANGPEPRRE